MDDKIDDKQIYELKARIERLQSQKDTLLKELDRTEERFETTQKLYQRYFPLIIDLFSQGKTDFPSTLKELSVELKKGSSTERIESLFKRVHDTILKEEPVIPEKKGKSLFSGLFKGSGNQLMEELRQGYLDVINTLKSTLDSSYLSTLNALSNRIMKARDSQSMGDVRKDLFDLIYKYMGELGADREKLSIFVQDIVKKILDMEELILLSFDSSGETLEPGEGFDLLLTGEIDRLKTDIDVAKDLDTLRAKITSSLATIEVALKQKVTKEQGIKEVMEKNRSVFQSGFDNLKKELVQATQHSIELEKKLNQDPLTGAFNRRAYNKRMEDEMERFLRYGTIFSLLFIDADHFKNINDTYGHAIGDKCLQEIIKRISPLLRKSDMVARYGGEEFVVVMPETDGEGARDAAEKIRQTIEKIEFLYKNDSVRVTVSIGATQAREGDALPQNVFDRADAAVYKAKEGGRNMVVLN